MTLRRSLFACAIALAALLPASVRAQIPGTANIQVGGTNIIGGTSGRCLYDNAGKIGETASCGLAGGITVGTSVITGGTTTRVLFDNAGVLGEYTAAQLSSFMSLGTASTQNTGTSGANVPLLSTTNTWSLAQTFTAAPVFTDQSGSRTALGLGTAATQAFTSGTCTPTFAGQTTAGTGQTYAANGQVCNYEQLASRRVTVQIWISATSLGTASGNLLVQGLPITSNATTGNFGVCVAGFYSGITGLAANNFGITGLIRPSTTQIEINSGASTGSSQVTAAQAGNLASFALTCSYQS